MAVNALLYENVFHIASLKNIKKSKLRITIFLKGGGRRLFVDLTNLHVIVLQLKILHYMCVTTK